VFTESRLCRKQLLHAQSRTVNSRYFDYFNIDNINDYACVCFYQKVFLPESDVARRRSLEGSDKDTTGVYVPPYVANYSGIHESVQQFQPLR